MLTANPLIARADEIQDRFDEAMAAIEAERIYTAQRLLQALLADYPTLHRARLELARADYLARDYGAAEAEIQQVLNDSEVPPSVRTTLLALQAQIRDDQQTFGKRHRWSGDVYGGTMYDSNVNFGVARDIVDIGGVFFNVDPGSQEISDGALVADAGVVHTYNPDSRFRAGEKTGFFLWQSQGNAYYRRYFDETDYNLGVATVRTGPVWVVPDTWRATIGLQGDQIWLGNDNLAFFTTLNPVVTRILSPLTEVSAGFTVTKRSYQRDEDDGRDGTFYRANAGFTRVFMEQRIGLQGVVGYTDFDADNDSFSYKGPDLLLGVTYNAWTGGTFYTSAGYRQFDFEAPLNGLPPGTPPRDDDEYRIIAGVNHVLQGDVLTDWEIQAEWAYTKNKSNISLFDFDRHQVSLGLARDF